MDITSKVLAIERCVSSRASLTPNRLAILVALLKFSKPITAYELQESIAETQSRLNISTVYRVIDFWCSIGVIHKISSLNKFCICADLEEAHTHIMNVCTKCENVFETCNERMGIDLSKGPKSMGLTFVREQHIELPVVCGECV